MGTSHFTILDFAVMLQGNRSSKISTTFITAYYLTLSVSPHAPPPGSPAYLRPAARVDRRGEVNSPQTIVEGLEQPESRGQKYFNRGL
jgi:hypothetical protein